MTHYQRAEEMVRGLTKDGGVLSYTSEQARLLLRVLRTLASGRPVTTREVDAIASELGWAPAAAHAFLWPLTERDAADSVIGVLGLSLGDHPHRFWLNGQRMSTWCAEDTLFLPGLLGQAARIDSTSPISRKPIHLTAGPEGLQSVSPAAVVVSVPILNPEDTLGSVEAIWTTFCRHIHFFAPREEAEQWAAVRADIAILTVDEGYRLGRQLMSRVLEQAE